MAADEPGRSQSPVLDALRGLGVAAAEDLTAGRVGLNLSPAQGTTAQKHLDFEIRVNRRRRWSRGYC